METPVTRPDVGFTVATEVLLLDQLPPGVLQANADVPPIHTLVFPVMAATVGFTQGAGLMLTVPEMLTTVASTLHLHLVKTVPADEG